MPAPVNNLKRRLAAGETLFGAWLSMTDSYSAEVMGTTGFDWLVIDGEHAPNDIRTIRNQMIALQSSPSDVMVRVPIGEPWIIKQVLDVGAQSILVPMVESGAQARQMVRACAYPPKGIRGVGAAAARASHFGTIPDYITTADDQMLVMVQVESRAGVAALDDILAVEGVGGVFIGPSDLSSDMGYRGDSLAPEVQDTIRDVLGRTAAAGKVPAIMCLDDRVQTYVDWGARFVAVAIDIVLMSRAARESAARWRAT